MEILDYVCTRCLRIFNLRYLLKRERSLITTCDVCDSENRRCLVLEQSARWDGIIAYDKLRYDDYHVRSTKHSGDREVMWRHGVELDMGTILCFICRNIGVEIPIDIIKLIYKIAKQIPKGGYYYKKLVFMRY